LPSALAPLRRRTLPGVLLLLLAAPAEAGPPQRYSLDPAGSAVTARVAFFGLASRTAHFPELSGAIALTPASSATIDLDVTIDARALTAGDRVTLDRLRGPSFFDVGRHPAIRFAGRTMRMTGRRTADIPGELTARGITKPATLRVTFDRAPEEQSGRDAIGLTGRMTIDRRDFGMNAYSLIVGNRVTIELTARMVPVSPRP
jgi:polyisoprenoid-binding protein YceI